MPEQTVKQKIGLSESLMFRLLPAVTSVIAIINGIIAGQFIDEKAVGVVSRVIEAVALVLLAGSVVMCERSMGEEDKDELFALKHAVLTKAFPLGFAVAVVSFFITLPLPGLYFRTGSETYVMARQTGKGDPLKNLGIRMVMSIAKEVTYHSFVGLNVPTVRI